MRDEELRAALLAASEADWAALSGPEEVPAFSPRYQRWEQRFRRDPRRGGRTAWGPVARRAVCFLLAAPLTGALVLECSPAARAWVIEWFTIVHETHTSYVFQGDTERHELSDWLPTYLPEGYEEADRFDADDISSVFYDCDDPELSIAFDRMSLQSGTGVDIDNEHHAQTIVSIHGLPGYLLTATDGGQNLLLWFDESNEVAFMLTARLSSDELILIAESVQ